MNFMIHHKLSEAQTKTATERLLMKFFHK